MPISQLLLRLITFLLIGLLSVLTAMKIVDIIEERSVLETQEALIDSGNEWASVTADGLQVALIGEAPSEAARFRATAAAGRIIDANRVIDQMSVAQDLSQQKPDFAIEFLRNDSGISLIGLIPSSTDQDSLRTRLQALANDDAISNLLTEADFTPSSSWPKALNYALTALEELPYSKISVNEARVVIEAISQSAIQKNQIETRLARRRPDGIQVSLKITAPRPLISPFITRFTLDQSTGGRFDACAVETERAKQTILSAAKAVGYKGPQNCTFGLGAPSNQWGEAVAQSIRALGQLQGGTVTVSNTDITLIANSPATQAEFDQIIGALENTLPDAFALTAEHPQAQDSHNDGQSTFTASLETDSGGTQRVDIGGRLPDELSLTLVKNLTAAKFSQKTAKINTRIVTDLPPLWSLRALTAIEALSKLQSGAVLVTQNAITVKGRTGDKNARVDISKLLLERLGSDATFDVDVSYDKTLDPISSLPTPAECILALETITKQAKISFNPGSTNLSQATMPVLDKIANVLKLCVSLKMEIAGYTDSQGPEDMNMSLSQKRADAVLSALRLRRIPVSNYKSVGYGEQNPIADNDTDAGREANRRIEFRLLQQ